MARSPIELLGAVLDEVEGIRQTDKRSHLPKMLMLELKDALQPAGSVNGCGAQLRDVDGLVGETIAQVFDCGLRNGDLVIVCESGAFIALEAEADGDDASISVCDRFNGDKGLLTYLRPSDMVTAGVMTQEAAREAERQEQIEAARKQLARAQATVNAAQAQLDRLNPPAAP